MILIFQRNLVSFNHNCIDQCTTNSLGMADGFKILFKSF